MGVRGFRSADRMPRSSYCPQCARAWTARRPMDCPLCGPLVSCGQQPLDLRPAPPAASPKKRPRPSIGPPHASTASRSASSASTASRLARAVAYFVDRYLQREGVLVEAGSGTSETSMLIDKRGGRARLVALDLIRPVLERCHPVMDVRVCGDIFALPFEDGSIDGIWNVGVMEHFTHPDRCHHANFDGCLKPGAALCCCGRPGSPSRSAFCACWNSLSTCGVRGGQVRFHPDEISQLRSVRQGREVLARNGFRPVAIDIGLRTLMAFETLVGENAAPVPDRTGRERRHDEIKRDHSGQGRGSHARPGFGGPEQDLRDLPGYEMEVICVDDHCRDRTAAIARSMARAWWRTGARPARATPCAPDSRPPAATCCYDGCRLFPSARRPAAISFTPCARVWAW